MKRWIESRSGKGRAGSGGSGVRRRLLTSLLAVVLLGGCDDDGGVQPPGTLRFAQVGEIRLRLESPLRSGSGRADGLLSESLTWASSGQWLLEEQISYRERVGDRTVTRSAPEVPGLAAEYASLIIQVNETEGLQLFIPELDPALEPECGDFRTRVSLTLHDDSRGEEVTWSRCADGTLTDLLSSGAGPDAAASRVIQAVRLARLATQGTAFRGTYFGSAPFGTLDRGEDSETLIAAPRVFRSPLGAAEPTGWRHFWEAHTGGASAPPPVDWGEDMVLVAADGLREEAGDSIEIRRVLEIDRGAIIEWAQRLPGDFCSPASRTQVPYHIAVVPRIEDEISFSDLMTERITCGGF